MDIKLPTNQRDQLMLFACFAAVGAIIAFYIYIFKPKTVALAALQTRVESLTSQNETARREIARGTASKLREEADRYGIVLARMRQLVPTANEVPTLVDQISTAARRAGLELADIQPLGVIAGPVFDTHKYKMVVNGPYHRLGQFFSNVGSMTRIVAPMNLTLVPVAAAAQGARPNEVTLNATFEIQTFVAKTAAAGGT